MDCSMPGLPVLHQLLELAQTHVHWVGDAIQPSHPLLSPSPPALNLSQHRVFSDESALCIRRPKYWSFSIILSNEYSGLISFRIDWFDLLEVQGTQESSPTPQLKSISSSAYNLLYGPTLTSMHDYWRNHSFNHMDLCRQSNVSTFYTLSRCVIAFLPRRKHLLISWLQSPSVVIWGPKKIFSHCFHCSPMYEVMGLDTMILIFECWVFSQFFQSPLSPSLRGSLVPLHFLP